MTDPSKTPAWTTAVQDIQAIRRFLTAMLPGTTYIANKDKSVTHEGDIDPESLNRSKVFIDGRPYNLSITTSWRTPKDDPTPRVSQPQPTEPLKFSIDHRSNPKLHQLYVGHARSAIRTTREFCEAMWGRSRWPDSDIASTAWAAVAQHCREDAAWFEAAALEFLHQEEDPLPNVVAIVQDLEPGEYVGHIEDRDGQLVFVIDPETPVD